MNPTRLCILRHGETDWNIEKRIQGQIDIPLNAAGRAQAAATAAGLAAQRFDAIYSSDLARTWQTAQPIAAALGLPLNAAPALRERHYGQMQGLTGEEARRRFPALHAAYAARDPQHDLDGGESLAHFAARVAQALRDLAGAHAGQTLLLVAHGGVLDIAYRLATGRGIEGPRDFPIPNAGLNWLEYRETAWRLVAWGEKAHLEAALDEVG
ncbi:MAG: phosphoglycerate kinase [Rhodocyclales bacterium GWA2_65_20]|nr:MAG: phosphoglycerate kinase [Rhodocyclales bacterium GWA2_65_20]